FVAQSAIGFELRLDELRHRAVRADLRDEAGMRIDEAEPEAQERVEQAIPYVARFRPLRGERKMLVEVSQAPKLVEIIVQAAFTDAGPSSDIAASEAAARERHQDHVVLLHLAQLLAQVHS